MTHLDPYPVFTRSERIADGVMHVAGVSLALLGTLMMVIWAVDTMDPGTVAGVSVYGAALIASFMASAIYHFTPWERPRPLFRRLDHAAIYLKIAGTYTPLVVLIGSAFAYSVLAVVWALAAIGAIAKLFFWGRPGHCGTVLYLGLGWISVMLLSSLFPLLPTAAIVCLVIGGLLYSFGAVIFSIEGLRFQNAIWHGFVLAASACFFTAIALGLGTVT